MAALALALALSACRDAALPFAGPAPAPGGRERVQQALTALYERYANVHLGPRYLYARQHLSSAALVPSRVFNDSALWTGAPDSATRRFELREFVTPAGVTEQEAADSVAWPSRLGDAKHVVTLRKLPDGDYAWNTNATIALGARSAPPTWPTASLPCSPRPRCAPTPSGAPTIRRPSRAPRR